MGVEQISDALIREAARRLGEAARKPARVILFGSYARGEAENPCTAEDAMEALRIALAARQSLRERRPIGLSEIA